MCYVTDGIKATNKQEVKINQRTKIKFDSGICILVRIVSEANKVSAFIYFENLCVAASVHGACESRQASPGWVVTFMDLLQFYMVKWTYCKVMVLTIIVAQDFLRELQYNGMP
ncbi:hypothetical protein GQ457_16G018850 [Hibiscus cannabinus]